MVSASVVIPVYNAADFVEDAVVSALAQTLTPREIVCVNDGSTDASAERLTAMASRWPDRLRVIHQQNQGPSAARNTGLEAATGDYVQFLDADDLLDPSKIERQVEVATRTEPRADMVVSSYWRLPVGAPTAQVVDVEDDPWSGLLCGRLGITSANLWSAAAVRDVGGWSEDMHTSEDPDLAFRVLSGGFRVVTYHKPLTTLRRRPDSQWNRDKMASLRGWLQLRSRMWSHLCEHGLDTPERRRVLEAATFRLSRPHMSLTNEAAREIRALIRDVQLPVAPHGEPLLYRIGFRAFGFAAAEDFRRWHAGARRRLRLT